MFYLVNRLLQLSYFIISLHEHVLTPVVHSGGQRMSCDGMDLVHLAATILVPFCLDIAVLTL